MANNVGSVAEVFATCGLDISQLNANAQTAEVRILSMAQKMALPVREVDALLKEVSISLGKLGASGAIRQLAEQGYSAEQAARLLILAIQEQTQKYQTLADIQKARAAAEQDADKRRVEMMDREQSAINEIIRLEKEATQAAVGRQAAEKALSDSVVAFYAQQDKAARALEQTQLRQASQLRQAAESMTQLGTLTLAAFAPLDAALVGSLVAFKNFDAAMTRSLSILGDVSKGLKDNLANAAIELSSKFTFSASEIAGAIYSIGSAGYTAEGALSVLPTVTKFATAAFTDLGEATRLLTSAQSALGLRSDDAAQNMANMARIGDVLVKADTLATGTSKQFAEALFNVSSTMRQLNVPLEQGVAGLAVFAKAGIVGRESGTQLGIVLRDLSTKAITHAAAWEKLNVEVYDSQGNFNSLSSIVGQLEEHFKGLSAEQVRYDLLQSGIQQRSMRFLLTLMGNADAIREFEGSLKSAGGTMDEVAEKNLQSLSAKMEILKNNATNLAIKVGGSLVDAFGQLLDKNGPLVGLVQDLADSFESLSPAVKTATVEALAFAAVGGTLAGSALFTGGYILRAAADLKYLGVTMQGITDILGVASVGGAIGLVGLIGTSLVAALAIATKQWSDYQEVLNSTYEKQKAFYDLYNKQHPTGGKAQGPAPETDEQYLNRLRGGSAQFTKAEGQSVAADLKAFTVIITDNSKAVDDNAAKFRKWGQDSKEAANERKIVAAALKAEEDSLKGIEAQNRLADQAEKELIQTLKFFKASLSDLEVDELTGKIKLLEQAYISGRISLQEFWDRHQVFLAMMRNYSLQGAIDQVSKLTEEFRLLGVASVKFGSVNPGSPYAAVADTSLKSLSDPGRNQDLADKKLLRVDTADLEGATNLMAAMNRQLDSQYTSLGQLEAEWAQASRDIARVAKTDLPSVIALQDKYINRLAAMGESEGRLNLLRQAALSLVIQEKTLRGEGANKLLIQLENERLAFEALTRSTQRWGQLYIDTMQKVGQLTDKMATDFVDGIVKLFDNSANKALDKQIADLNKAMAEATRGWEQAQLASARAIEKINTDADNAIRDAIEANRRNLEDASNDYNKFMTETQQKLVDLVAAHAESQRQIQDNLTKNLRDAAKDYERFVEDTQEAIRRAQAKGDLEQVADLQKALKRRTEDYNQYIADTREAAAKALEADHKAQAKETEDINKQMQERAAAFSKYQEEQAAAFKKQIADIEAKRLEDVAAEQKSLEEKRLAYEQYVEDYKLKLKELENAHKSTFDRIGELFKAMLVGFATELGKFIASDILKGYLRDLTKSITGAFKIPTIPGISGGGSPVQLPSDLPPGSDVSLPDPRVTGPTSGTPSTSSGSGIVDKLGGLGNVIGLGVDIASGISQGIQLAHIENDIAKIEVSTRGALNQLIAMQGTMNTFLPQLNHFVDIWDTLNQIRDVLWYGIINVHGAGGGGGGEGDLTLTTADFSWANDQREKNNAHLNDLNQTPGATTPVSYIPPIDGNANVWALSAEDAMKPGHKETGDVSFPSDHSGTFSGWLPTGAAGYTGSNGVYVPPPASLRLGPNPDPYAPVKVTEAQMKMIQALIDAGMDKEAKEALDKIRGFSDTTPPPRLTNPFAKYITPGSGSALPFQPPAWLTPQPWESVPSGSGPDSAGNRNVFNVIVPNPDGDVVIRNLMDAASKRGLRLM